MTPHPGGVGSPEIEASSARGAHDAPMSTPDYLHANQAEWTAKAGAYADAAPEQWASQPTWGIWDVPDSEVGLVNDVVGRDVLEVGCGTAYVSSWFARAGARPVALDPTWAQLKTARQQQAATRLAFPLVAGIGEQLPFADASFDLVLSEYGSAIWSDPYRWIPEAARVLRPGGDLAFLCNSTLLIMCADDDETVPATARLRRAQRGLHRVEWPHTDAVEFHLSHGDWIRLLRTNGLEVLELRELYPPESATASHGYVDADWASRWPSEELWRARKNR